MIKKELVGKIQEKTRLKKDVKKDVKKVIESLLEEVKNEFQAEQNKTKKFGTMIRGKSGLVFIPVIAQINLMQKEKVVELLNKLEISQRIDVIKEFEKLENRNEKLIPLFEELKKKKEIKLRYLF